MTDLVERLRDCWLKEPVQSLVQEAADEIERLRAEVEKLGRDYETARDAHDRRVRELDTHCAEVATLRAANERLREALWKVVHDWEVPQDGNWNKAFRDGWDKARAALTEPTP